MPPLPPEAANLLQTFLRGLHGILGDKLYGVYLYGASVFPDPGPLQDLDCHVIVREKLTGTEKAAYQAIAQDLAARYPGWGEELDAYTILLEQARGHQVPQHQVFPEIFDHAWALHCAHVRAGYFRVLYGPEPAEIFPAPTWQAVDAALQHELEFVLDHPQYPAYGILNLCRILYNYESRNPVVSKQSCGRWGQAHFSEWSPLIRAAVRFYRKEQAGDDLLRLETQSPGFYAFMVEKIREAREGWL